MKNPDQNSFAEELSDEEIQQLLSEIPEASPERAREYEKSMQEIQAYHDQMLYETYPKLSSLCAKHGMWYYFLQHQELSRENYEKWKSVEPQIDLMMDSHARGLGIKERDYLRMGRTDYHQVGRADDPRYAHLYEEPKKWWEFWK